MYCAIVVSRNAMQVPDCIAFFFSDFKITTIQEDVLMYQNNKNIDLLNYESVVQSGGRSRGTEGTRPEPPDPGRE